MFDPETLGYRARRLWTSLFAETDDEPTTTLVIEACRTVDRLDALDHAITRDGIVYLFEDQTGEFEVRINSPVAEARQTMLALSRLLTDIDRRKSVTGGPDDGDVLGGL